MKEHYDEHNINEEDIQNMGALLGSANQVLDGAVKKEKMKAEISGLITKSDLEELDAIKQRVINREMDDTSDFLSNIFANSEQELFFRTLIDEVPNLGLSISTEAKDIAGKIQPGLLGIKTQPYKTDRLFLSKLTDNPAIKFLMLPTSLEKEGRDLEAAGVLPQGTVDSILSRHFNVIKKEMSPKALNSFYKEEVEQFKNIPPISDEDLQDLMRKYINEEYRKNL